MVNCALEEKRKVDIYIEPSAVKYDNLSSFVSWLNKTLFRYTMPDCTFMVNNVPVGCTFVGRPENLSAKLTETKVAKRASTVMLVW